MGTTHAAQAPRHDKAMTNSRTPDNTHRGQPHNAGGGTNSLTRYMSMTQKRTEELVERLTKPQLQLLTDAVSRGRESCSISYPPARKLVELGLLSSHEGRLGGHWVEPTEAGIAALRAQAAREGK